jgi:glycine betaine/choline ABC-type transport system substrate-binding protein
MKNLSTQAQIEVAMQMVIMDAIERGNTDIAGLTEYMGSETFKQAVKRYIEMM